MISAHILFILVPGLLHSKMGMRNIMSRIHHRICRITTVVVGRWWKVRIWRAKRTLARRSVMDTATVALRWIRMPIVATTTRPRFIR